MRKIILIKHAMSRVSSDIASNQWMLTEEGKKGADQLAIKLKSFDFDTIFSSDEPKATETAGIVAERLGKETIITKGLHEQERESNRVIYPREEWKALMKRFFDEPDTLVFGDETAREAKERFRDAVEKVLDHSVAEKDVVIVAHGVVLSLLIADYNDVKVFEIWESLGLPSYAELDAESFKLLHIENVKSD
ncbi:histidine phosphatase family protein [Halobacillus fulvus]|nr:histidine phosphatase family protein [Halobacillus fulvus]